MTPGSKYRSIADSPGTERERTSHTPITPLRRLFSSGTVTYCSTSWLESPSASVCTSRTGPELSSGTVSVCMPLTVMTPTTSRAAPSPARSTRKRSAAANVDPISICCELVCPVGGSDYSPASVIARAFLA